ncbi:MAG: MBL fold metallo-hydrolase [Christensenellales bacterium]
MKYSAMVDHRYGANTYVLWDEQTKKGLVVDPAGDADAILRRIGERGVQVEMIVLTHGHFDHISAAQALREALRVPIAVHEADAYMLPDPLENRSALFTREHIRVDKADRLLKDGDVLAFGDSALSVLHTPGHSRGGIALVGDSLAVTGDTLMAGSIGRCDFEEGNIKDLQDSLSRLTQLDESLTILPGHGPASTIAREKKTNPFLTGDLL